MNLPEINFPMLLGAWLLGVLATAIIFRIVFDVKKHFWFQQRQLDILARIAEQQGVPSEDVYEILQRK